MRLFKKWRADKQTKEQGQSLVEVALILLLVSLAAIVIINVMEPTVANVFSEIVDEAPLAPPSIGDYTPPPTPTIDPLFTPSATPIPPSPTNTPIPSATPSPSSTPSFEVSVNFQRPFDPLPAGFELDGGAAYGNRGNGYTYGWGVTNSNGRDRDNGASPGQEYDTLNHMQDDGRDDFWEIEVPNGDYTVYLVAGDPSFYNSTYIIEVEGVIVVSGVPSSANPWIEGTTTVTVTDGRLTVSNGPGSNNNKINFIEISN